MARWKQAKDNVNLISAKSTDAQSEHVSFPMRNMLSTRQHNDHALAGILSWQNTGMAKAQ